LGLVMADDSAFGLAVAAAIDLVLRKPGARHRWVRLLNVLRTLTLIALIAALVYVTFAYW